MELGPAGMRGQESERCVALQFRELGSAEIGVLPEMVCHADAIESEAVGGPNDLGQRGTETGWLSFPAIVIDLKSEFHGWPPTRFFSSSTGSGPAASARTICTLDSPVIRIQWPTRLVVAGLRPRREHWV